MTHRDSEAFESFPRRRLAFKWGRRQVLSLLSTELHVRADRVRGGSAFKLPDLGCLPDELLELMTPVIVADCTRTVSPTSPATRVLTYFDGETPLHAIARSVAEEFGWPASRAFAYVRGVFLHVVTEGICVPK